MGGYSIADWMTFDIILLLFVFITFLIDSSRMCSIKRMTMPMDLPMVR